MKKLTGYIGAMIIVFALMGSILLGYALNINGTTEVINEYDDVTDVSGLYSYSDEKSYIDYNPASNYINYDYKKPFNSDLGMSYKKLVDSDVVVIIDDTNDSVTYNGKTYYPDGTPDIVFACEYGYVMYVTSTGQFSLRGNLSINNIGNATITITGNDAIVETGGNQYSYINCKKMFLSSNSTDSDYIMCYGTVWGGTTGVLNAYYDNTDEIFTYSICPQFNNDIFSSYGQTFTRTTTGIKDHKTTWQFSPVNVEGEVKKIDPVYSDWTDTLFGSTATLQGLCTIYPKTAYNTILGVDYTESNRVNNYPTSQYSENRTTTTNQFNLSNMTGILTDYAPADEQRSGRTAIIGRTPDFAPPGNSLMTDITWSWPNSYKVYNFLLADIINSQAIPATTYQIKLTFNSNSYSTFSGLLATAQMNKNFDINTACLNYNEWYVDTVANYNTANNKIIEINDCYGEKEYVMYDPATGIIDIYNYNDVKIATRSAYNTYVTCFIYDNGALGSWDGLFYYRTYWSDYSKNQYIQTNPMISSGGNTNLVTATYYQMSSTPATYMDVTKGVKINSSNVSDTIWNNEYENGDVQIVFRSESIGNNYTNQIQTMAGDIITVEYTDSKYYAAINSEEPVEIGNWRNIVLDLNFNHDTVSVYPVKTFNSFIDVVVYNIPINIGKITHTDNTQLKWLPTTNSLMFSIYKTSVFMNTYGIVMVNPSLDITNYFTDLNDFYRLKIYNFSIYGDDMTINGTTGTVTGNNITFDETTILLNEMYVTYADGHVYIEDSHSSVDLGEITTTGITMTGAWYFQTFLEKGYTSQKYVYDWDWSSFILDNTQFCIFYIGIALAGLIIARKFCSLSIIDYVIFLTSIVLALSIQVIA